MNKDNLEMQLSCISFCYQIYYIYDFIVVPPIDVNYCSLCNITSDFYVIVLQWCAFLKGNAKLTLRNKQLKAPRRDISYSLI